MSAGRGTADNAGNDWPETPGELLYLPDAVLELFARVQQGERIDLLEGLLDCVNWAEMFGGVESGFLLPEQLRALRRYYHAKFAAVEPYYLAEQLSTELMSALIASGDFVFSDALKRLGREQPALWQEIRTFFSRKEVALAQLMLAADPRSSRNG
ncbi:MAG: hypothetical protein DCC58_13620 [Chloroflexi bacterium]|nr:MAG: hypothetical protein DCC58_13620 [Chloroflexota bacterium]